MLKPLLPCITALALAVSLTGVTLAASATDLRFEGRQISVDAVGVQGFMQSGFPQRYAPLGPLLELTLSNPRLAFPPGQRMQLDVDLAVSVGDSRMDMGTAQLSSALRYDRDQAALMLDQPQLESFSPAPGAGQLDANGRNLVNAWLQDYARSEPVYRLDPALTAMLGGMQVQDARIADGRLVLEFDRDVSGLGPAITN